MWAINTLVPEQNQRYFSNDIFKCISLRKKQNKCEQISRSLTSKGKIDKVISGYRRQRHRAAQRTVYFQGTDDHFTFFTTQEGWQLWTPFYEHGLTGIRRWISNHSVFVDDVITYPCHDFNGGFTKPPLKLRHGLVITPHWLTWMYLLILALITMRFS